MKKSMKEKRDRLIKILEKDGVVDILDKTINNHGNIFVSNSQKEGQDVRGYKAVVVILNKEA